MNIDQLIELVKLNTEEANNRIIEYLSANKNFDLNQLGENGRTLLTSSITSDNITIFNYLLENKIDLLRLDGFHHTPAHYAMWISNGEYFAKILDQLSVDLSHEYNIKKVFNVNSIDHDVISTSNVNVIKILSKHNYKLADNSFNHFVRHQNFETMEYCLKNLLFNIEKKDLEGYTSLHYTIKVRDFLLARYFIDQGADIHVCNNAGENILYTLIYNQDLFSSDLALQLINQNIDYNFAFPVDQTQKFLDFFLKKEIAVSRHQSLLSESIRRFDIFKTLMIKQFFKHNKIFQKAPDQFKQEVLNHIQEFTKSKNVSIGVDEYTEQVIIFNSSKSISEIVPKYWLMLRKNSTIPNQDPLDKLKAKASVPTLKQLATLAIKDNNVFDKLFMQESLIIPDLEPLVAAAGILQTFLPGNSVEIVID